MPEVATYVAYENKINEAQPVVCNGELEPITRNDREAVPVRIFLKEDERTELKKACDHAGVTMTHLARTLLVEWLKNRHEVM